MKIINAHVEMVFSDTWVQYHVRPVEIHNIPVNESIVTQYFTQYEKMLMDHGFDQANVSNDYGPAIAKSIRDEFGSWFRERNLKFSFLKYWIEENPNSKFGDVRCSIKFKNDFQYMLASREDALDMAEVSQKAEEHTKLLNNIALMFKMTFC